MTDNDLMARLEAMDAKLDYVVDRQRYAEELVRSMTPVAREGVNAMAEHLAGWEERGWFDMGHEFVGIFDRLAAAYGPEDVAELSEHVVQLVDTVRNLTQADVLDLANDATDVIHDADKVEPVGAFGLAKATRDPEVQRGLAVAIEVLRQIGRARAPVDGERRPAPVRSTPAPSAPRSAAPSKPAKPAKPAASTTAAARQPAPSPDADADADADADLQACVVWEGRRFSPEGFLVDYDQWDKGLAAKMAEGLGIVMTAEHWQVVEWVRHDAQSIGASPNVRRIALGSGVGTRRLYELFPGTPGKSVAMIAGVGKPVGCV